MMLFASTRNRENTAAFAEALLKGLSPDGGLYVPQAWARLSPDSFGSETDLPGIADRLLAPFVAGAEILEGGGGAVKELEYAEAGSGLQ